jgi:hypothetical protein
MGTADTLERVVKYLDQNFPGSEIVRDVDKRTGNAVLTVNGTGYQHVATVTGTFLDANDDEDATLRKLKDWNLANVLRATPRGRSVEISTVGVRQTNQK